MKRMKISTLATAVSLALYGGQAVYAGCSAIPGNLATPFVAGPLNPNNGFPEFVTDSSGTSLELCIDATPGIPAGVICATDPVIAGNLLSEQIGFGAEAFWWLAQNDVLNTAGPLGTTDVIVVMAAEAAFLPDVAEGNQFPFTRLRVRLDVPAPGVYTLTHPFGTEEFTVDTVGAGQEVRTSFDIAMTADTQNQGCVAPWLEWDPAESIPPVGFIGDGATPHTVTGGPNGNVVSLSATDLAGNPLDLGNGPGAAISTNLFTVVGKLYDGVLATPMVVDRTTYERDAAAVTGQVDVFATAATGASVTFSGGPNLPAGSIPLIDDPLDPRVSDPVSSLFYNSALLTPDATVIPATVSVDASLVDPATDGTHLLRRVTDLVTIAEAQYNIVDSTLTVLATSSDAILNSGLTVAEYGVPVPADILTAAPPATVNVTSAAGGTHELQVTVVESAPPVANDDAATTDEDTPLIGFDIVANDTDADGINATSVIITSSATNGLLLNNGDGTVRYIPNANFNGSDSFTYTVRDNLGLLSNLATGTITVIAVNDPPVANNDTAATEGTIPVTIAVLDNDSDVDIASNGDVLSVSVTTPPANGSAVANTDNTVTYTANAGYSGVDTFVYTVTDNASATDAATVTVNVAPAGNVAPVAVDDTFSVAEDSGANILNVLVNDTDTDGDNLSVISVTQPAAATGSVINNGTSVSYTPPSNFNGSTSFSYAISDGNGHTATANVNVTVTPVNDSPVAIGDTASTTAGTPVVINVLNNDIDVDGDTLMITAVTTPANGTAVANANNTITYTSTVDFAGGVVTFDYTVSDGNGGSATAQVGVNVTAVAGAVDLDITSLRTTGRVRGAGQTVTVSLAVRLITTVSENRPATIVGVTAGATEVYRQTLQVNDAPGRGSTTFNFPNYITNGNEGTITWTATLVDDDPDIDQATDTTLVR
jgi:hypothetical protein